MPADAHPAWRDLPARRDDLEGPRVLVSRREVGGRREFLLRLKYGEPAGEGLADDGEGVGAEHDTRRRRLLADAVDNDGGHLRGVAGRDRLARLDQGADRRGRGAIVGGQPGPEPGTAVAELGARSAGLDDRRADTERGDFLAD